MAMVFIEGRDLGQILKEHVAMNTMMPAPEVLRIIQDIAGALDYAHAGGVIHRDIKPSNIMVATHDNHAILTDFGLALSVPEGSLGNTFGSAHYIAPEQAISSANAVAQSDLYSLGVVLYQMLTGKVPFDDPSAMSVALKHLSDPPPSLRQWNPQLSTAVERVVLKALEKEPSRRFQNGALMVQALEQALDIGSLDSRSMPSITTSRPSRLFPPGGPSNLAKTQEISTPTLKFSDSQVAESRSLLRRAQRRGLFAYNRAILFGGIVVVILVIVAAILLIGRGNQGATATTPTAAVVAAASDVPTEANLTVTEPLVSSNGVTPSSVAIVPTTAAPLVTEPPTDVASLVPSEIATLTEVVTAAQQTAQSNRAVLVSLIYDGDKLVLINRSGHTIDIRGWKFVQSSEFGEISFLATQWQTALLSTVQPESCFMIWRNSLSGGADTPDYCVNREAWFAAGTNRRFWISDEADATFEVHAADGTVLATCPVNEGECEIAGGTNE